MNKKLLRNLPIQKSDNELLLKAAHENEKIRYIATAERRFLGGVETLVINLFQVSGKTRSDISLEYRIFCQKDDYISQDMKSEKIKWKTGSLLYLTCNESGWGQYWWSTSEIMFLEDKYRDKSEKMMHRWIGKDNQKREWKNHFDCIEEYQNNIQSNRLEKKHKKITDVIDTEMEKFGSVPDDYQDFAKERLFAEENYLFYNKKEKTCYCSHCGKEFVITPYGNLKHESIPVWNDKCTIRHGDYGVCPYCNSYEKFISEGYQKGKLFSVKWSVLVQRSTNRELLVRYFCHTKDFRRDYRNPRYTLSEQFRTVQADDKSVNYEWNRFKSTGKVRWIYQRVEYTSYFAPSELVLPRSITLYNQDIDSETKGTCMEYSCAGEFLDYIENNTDNHSPWVVDQYFNEYRERPWVEQLIKCGFIKMAYEIFREYRKDKLDFKHGKTICESLGITKNMFNMLRKISVARLKDIEILKWFNEALHREPTEEEFADLRFVQDNGYSDMYKKFIDAMRFTTIHKLRKYITANGIYQYKDYFDYLEWIEEMGYDMKNSFYLFPKDFKKSHDDKSVEYIAMKDKKAAEDLKRFNKVLRKMRKDANGIDAMNMKINGLFIRMPFELDELKTEGETLHHCVGTYRDKVAKGKTMIFFIRKIEEPEKPFYTLEWNGKVEQCRGMRNCNMTPDVKAFVKLFSEKMVEYEHKPLQRRKVE